ncbi:ATP-binding cassette domain-containing protein [Ponticoccus sp. SC2-23]|uniref:ABC transporter ATP-binding protein n=1 Tax=Alexandriicola marinus TaxID=2081710 RepID=UPI000FDC91B8|nr:oligopeptide/dipeptide ABC transporter ATP-binding protein [Alexandriicola marinus]MBM1219514.1 ATP-binding cassette domain-containing protein [Ponticoccus sp. SC6-9]MBM1223414.1 ATP-binding cassette domain-containing protein [Ponticoccus sp. SC6-15]MBM1229327.1 ATP-binding cassette domain-containing protein [Ponticoccus sp. SC6-38]MBM1232380.1 ATP-binding cassette domain-containing protein [Ponticoccus sp. SC6-45]MBM1237670.1 ATP-binding cassette domain-containing protein [Ponticoccus sp. 
MSIALRLTELTKTFEVGKRLIGPPKGRVRAVQPVTLDVTEGETLGIVGESGCGKSTLARMLVGLLPPSSGTIEIDGAPLDNADPAIFGRKIQYVFQDTISSLNPRKTIRQIMEAPLRHLHKMDAAARKARISEIFEAVNLREEFLDRYPHEFSGGQAQRIGIARALAADARILVLDEPVSALDVSIQAQVLNLLARLKAEFGLTYLFISHDLAVVEAVSDRVAVLYFGAVVEVGPADRVFSAPRHPYTKLLADSAPVVGRALAAPEGRETELPDPMNPPEGCAFRARCPNATAVCATAAPPLERQSDGVQVACYNPL